jgi:RAB6A-GEF complex partner protein 2
MPTSQSDLLPELIEQRRKRLLAKSLSVSISPGELEKQLPEGTLVKPTSPRSPYSTGFGSGLLGIINESNRSQSRSPTPPSPTTGSSAFETPSVSTSTSTALSSPFISPTSETSGFNYGFAVPSAQFATRHAQGQLSIGLGPPPKGSRPAFLNSDTSTIPHRPASLDLPLYSAPPYIKPSHSQPHPQLHHSQPHLPHIAQPFDAPYPSPYLEPRTASSISSPSFPITSHVKTELILYAYVQLTGSLMLLPGSNTTGASPNANSTLNQPETHAMKRLRAKLARRTVMGGGSMDITPSLQSMRSSSAAVTPTLLSAAPSLGSGIGSSPRLGPGPAGARPPRIRATHARSPSLTAEFFSSLLSPASPSSPYSALPPSPLPTTTNGTPRSALHRSSASTSNIKSLSISAGADDPRDGNDATDQDVLVDPESPLPMFDSQPSMLAVDLSLGPGESKSCASLCCT